MTLRARLTSLTWLLPPSRAKNALLRGLGHRVHPTARLGVCLVHAVPRFDVGADSVIGHGNVFRALRAVDIGSDAIVGQFNWFSVAPSLRLPDDGTAGTLRLGDHAVLTNRHYVDCSGGVRLARFGTLGGVRCTVLSHSVDLATGRQTLAEVTLAEHAFVSTNSLVMAGSRLAERAVLAAGSVTALHGEYDRNTLYGGVPAKPIRAIDGAYFHRSRAWIAQ